MKKKVLVDGDIIAYRSAFSAKLEPLSVALDKADEIIEEILSNTLSFYTKDDYIVYLTGSGNFRFDISKIYKQNRPSGEKPRHLVGIREHLIDKYNAVVSSGEEADDLIGIEATRLGPDVAIVASVDKDMLQIPCSHYNIRKKTLVTVDEKSGMKSFYSQILTGDAVDNIIGLSGIGPVTAGKILSNCDTEEACWNAVVAMYGGNVEMATDNARLLWLRRKEGEVWEPPTQRNK